MYTDISNKYGKNIKEFDEKITIICPEQKNNNNCLKIIKMARNYQKVLEKGKINKGVFFFSLFRKMKMSAREFP